MFLVYKQVIRVNGPAPRASGLKFAMSGSKSGSYPLAATNGPPISKYRSFGV
jgi:hypothetical protein